MAKIKPGTMWRRKDEHTDELFLVRGVIANYRVVAVQYPMNEPILSSVGLWMRRFEQIPFPSCIYSDVLENSDVKVKS